LLGVDGDVTDSEGHGPLIVLRSDNMLTVTGEVRGGKGRTFEGLDPAQTVGQRGGNGSTL